MATVTAIRPPPHAEAAQEEHASTETEEVLSATASATATIAKVTSANDNNHVAAENDVPPTHGASAADSEQQQQQQQQQQHESNQEDVGKNDNGDVHDQQHNDGHDDDDDDDQLGLSLSSPSPPETETRSRMIPSMADTVVSDDALLTTTTTANVMQQTTTTSETGVTASLLPRPLSLAGGNINSYGPLTIIPSSITTASDVDMKQPLPSNANGLADQAVGSTATTTIPLEARIMQLESSLETITQFCQTLLMQQNQNQNQNQDQMRHSREGSEATGDFMYASSNSYSPTTPHRETMDDLSQWPPSHHHLLESPEVHKTRQSIRQLSNSSRNSKQKRRTSTSGSSSSAAAAAGRGGKGLSSHNKTMSMLLLDIDPGESRGPSMIPFTSDLDACDEMDGDSVAGGCGEGRERRGLMGSSGEDVTRGGESGRCGNRDSPSIDSLDSVDKKGRSSMDTDEGEANSSSNDESGGSGSSSSVSSSQRRGRGGRASLSRRLSSSLKELPPRHIPENNLECQAYTTTHLEALRLRREAGKDRRAYSFNDSLTSVNSPEQKWSPTLDVLDGSVHSKQQGEEWTPSLYYVDGSVKEPGSTVTTDTFVEEQSSGESKKKKLDIIMPYLSLPGNATAPLKSNKQKTTEMKAVGTNTTPNKPAMLAHSISCASNMSSDTTKTLKSGNTNNDSLLAQQNKKLRAGSVSSNNSSSTAFGNSKERSQSISSSKSSQSGNKDGSTVVSTASDTAAAPPAPTSLTAETPSKMTPSKQRDAKKGKFPHKQHVSHHQDNKGKSPSNKHASHSSQQHPLEDNNKNNHQQQQQQQQTMKEYVMNDLLNIDSRNQDGSATEDIDANMEEFLRIPSKLEMLLLFSLAVCLDSFLYAWAMLPLKFVWGWVCLICSVCSGGKGIRGVKFHRRHLYPIMQTILIYFVYSQVLCPISIGKLYHWIRGQAMLKLYVLIAIVEVFDRLLCSFGQDAWDSLYWNTTRRPGHPRMFVSIIVVGVYVTVHSLFLFVHVATLSVAVNSADNALLTLLISGNFAEIKSTVFKKYNKQNLFKITTSDICERFKLALFLLLILFLNRFQGEMTSSMVRDYYSMCGIVFAAELISDWIKHSFITKFNLIKSSIYFDYALVLSGDVTGIGHEGLNLDYTHAAVKRLGLAQIPLVCVTARYLHEAVRFAIAFQGNGDVDHPVAALVDLVADGNKWKFYTGLLQGMAALVMFKIALGMCIRYVARGYLGGATSRVLKAGSTSSRKSSTAKATSKECDSKKKQ